MGSGWLATRPVLDVPNAADMVTSYIRSQPLVWRWLFSTPEWISGVKPLEKQLRSFRALWLAGAVASILLVIYVAI